MIILPTKIKYETVGRVRYVKYYETKSLGLLTAGPWQDFPRLLPKLLTILRTVI